MNLTHSESIVFFMSDTSYTLSENALICPSIFLILYSAKHNCNPGSLCTFSAFATTIHFIFSGFTIFCRMSFARIPGLWKNTKFKSYSCILSFLSVAFSISFGRNSTFWFAASQITLCLSFSLSPKTNASSCSFDSSIAVLCTIANASNPFARTYSPLPCLRNDSRTYVWYFSMKSEKESEMCLFSKHGATYPLWSGG